MFERARQRVSDFAADWGAPIVLGLTTAAVIWTIWYVTRAPCTTVAAANGLCNPGVVARYITVEILLQSGGAALAVGALKGGYDRTMMRRMINEERERAERERERAEQEREKRLLAEQQSAEDRKRVDETIQMVVEMVNEFREERRQAAEERQRDAATQQALLDAIVELTQQQNGNGHAENGGG